LNIIYQEQIHMIADGIKAITELASKSVSGILECKQEPPGVYYLRQGDGSLHRVIADTQPVSHQADSLKTVVNFANRYAERAAIWIEEDKVTCLIDEKVGGNHVSIDLPFSEPFQFLQSVAKDWKSKPLTQAELVLHLRTTFYGCLSSSDDLLACARNVRFRTTAESSGAIDRGKASVGKSIEQAVSGTKEMPEATSFAIPLYSDKFGFTAVVDVAIEINMTQERFYIIPIHGEIENAYQEARSAIAEFVLNELDENSPVKDRVYFGRP
jgi:hypothetical protein